MREDENPFYGCPLQEEDYQAGSKATVYRFHIPDPIPFRKSIRVTIEHGHANDRSDHFSSVAYWYQTEPHRPFPPLAPVEKRLPYALEAPGYFVAAEWEKTDAAGSPVFEDKKNGLSFRSARLSSFLTSYYGPTGFRYPALTTEGAQPDGLKPGTEARLTFPVEVRERYNVDFYFLQGPDKGMVTAFAAGADARPLCDALDGYAAGAEIGRLSLTDILLEEGANSIVFRVTGKNPQAKASEIAFVGMSLTPAARRFIGRWNLVGPFDAPDMTSLPLVYPPETEIILGKTYSGKGGLTVAWKKADTESGGMMRLLDLFQPNEQAIVYGLAYVHSPEDRSSHILLGSDDGVRVWLNDALVHSNPAYRGAYPDQDKVKVALKKGWNKVLVKVLQGAGDWGFYLRFVDPDGTLRYATEPRE
jgi:hypothetical protein